MTSPSRFAAAGGNLATASIDGSIGKSFTFPLARAASPVEVGLSPEKLALVAPAMHKRVEEGKAAGAVAIVARRGKVAFFETVGKRDIAAGAPMTAETIFRIYSMTKPVASVAAMMLVEEGKLGLEDPVSKHLPKLGSLQVFAGVENGELKTVATSQPPTVRDLLRHTSGFTYGSYANSEVDRRYLAAKLLSIDGSLEEMVDKLATLPLRAQPGSRFIYSVSTDVLSRLIEVVSGKPFDEFLSERVFAPLGMSDTGFFVPAEKSKRFAANYNLNLSRKLVLGDAPETSRFLHKPRLLSGGAGLVSTASDYMRFCLMLLGGGELNGRRLLKPETVAQMTKNQLSKEAFPVDVAGERPGVGFGLGFSVVVEKTAFTADSRLGEYGWGGAASTHFWISPEDDLAAIVLSQVTPFTLQMEMTVKPLVYNAIVD